MNNSSTKNIVSEKDLVYSFNKREDTAFTDIYSMYYDELFIFANSIFRNSDISPCDVVQDIFLNLLQNKSKSFDSLIGIKAYLYVSIRNRYKNHLSHTEFINKHREFVLSEGDLFEVDVVESELYALINNTINMLPAEYAEIFRLGFEGLSIDEIALKLGKEKRTIYNSRHKATKMLKAKIGNNKIFELIILLS